jgi:hypothetical protein
MSWVVTASNDGEQPEKFTFATRAEASAWCDSPEGRAFQSLSMAEDTPAPTAKRSATTKA